LPTSANGEKSIPHCAVALMREALVGQLVESPARKAGFSFADKR
jgi:hypothetical protein